MKQTIAPSKTPSPNGGENKPITATGRNKNPRSEFFVAAANMSWQLAIVVLVPVIGGFELDKRFGTLPALTIVGFVLAMAGMAVVVWRQLQIFSPATPGPRKEQHT